MDKVDHCENRESYLQLKNNRVSFHAHEIALLKDVSENQDLEKHSTS